MKLQAGGLYDSECVTECARDCRHMKLYLDKRETTLARDCARVRLRTCRTILRGKKDNITSIKNCNTTLPHFCKRYSNWPDSLHRSEDTP